MKYGNAFGRSPLLVRHCVDISGAAFFGGVNMSDFPSIVPDGSTINSLQLGIAH
jgi:hypothetical protein